MILITASDSPLARTAARPAEVQPILLAVDHPEDHERYSPMVSRQLHLMVVDILTTAVALRLPGDRRAGDAGDQAEPEPQALQPLRAEWRCLAAGSSIRNSRRDRKGWQVAPAWAAQSTICTAGP